MRYLAGISVVVVGAAVALFAFGGGGSNAATLTQRQIAEEAGIEGSRATGWHVEECVVEHIFTTRRQVVAAERRERARGGAEGPDAGLVVSTADERIGVELSAESFYCQQEVEERLSYVGHGGWPEGTPTTVSNAKAAIEALGLPIRLEEPEGENGVLVGRVHGSLGEVFAFFLFVNRSAPDKMPGVSGYPGFGEGGRKGGLLGGGLVDGYVFGSRELPRRGESAEQFKEQSRIEGEVEEALCMQATGRGCGI